MIYSVKGEFTYTEPNLAVIECGGVGYACRTTANTLAGLKLHSEVKLLTYLNVREDAVELFGFGDTSELNCFKMLISVTGVGPKAALSILSDQSPQGFALCVASGDSKALTRSQGIGAKIAQRIILELKDKIAKQGVAIDGTAFTKGAISPATMGNNAAEAISALVVLGFTNTEATKAISGISSDTAVDEMIKQALKQLSSL